MKFGDLATGTITRFDRKGRGVFDVPLQNGKTRPFLVPFTTIGDEVEASFIKRQEGCFVGKLTKIITPGPSRLENHAPRTTLAHRSPKGEGGHHAPIQNPGTLWTHIAYDDQLAFKRDMINRAFEDAGHDERVAEVASCPKTNPLALCPLPAARHFYRNRMDYAFGWQGELGLKEYGNWNRYLDLEDCTLLSPDAPKILAIFRDFMKRFPELKPWDVKKHEGDLRYVVIREGKNTGDRIIALVVKDLHRINDRMRNELTGQLANYSTSIVLAENPSITDLSYGRTIVPLKGKDTIEETINGTTYTIQLNSFFQTNSVMAAKLQDVVAGFVSIDIRNSTFDILDLYCGLGFFAIDLARRFPSVKATGYEIYEQMIELAKVNAEQNNVADRCTFESGKAEALDWKDIDADIVIVDPPRAGLSPKVIRALLEKEPRTIIYVSCNYHRLVNELNEFKKKYQVKDLKALDLFPHTPHVEVVARLELA